MGHYINFGVAMLKFGVCGIPATYIKDKALSIFKLSVKLLKNCSCQWWIKQLIFITVKAFQEACILKGIALQRLWIKTALLSLV